MALPNNRKSSLPVCLEDSTERSESNPGRSLGYYESKGELSGRQYHHHILAHTIEDRMNYKSAHSPLARHVQNQSRITPMRRICSFTDFYCVLLDSSAPAGRNYCHGLSLAGDYPAPFRRKYNPR